MVFNCNFGYGCKTLSEMQNSIGRWVDSNNNERICFRWSVVNKRTNMAIGTVEMFNRTSNDFFNNCGILRLDLGSEYECTTVIKNILMLLLSDMFEIFDCKVIATKVSPNAKERIIALKEIGFFPTTEQIIGQGCVCFDGFWLLMS